MLAILLLIVSGFYNFFLFVNAARGWGPEWQVRLQQLATL